MGNKNTTTLFNNTDEVMEIRVFRGLIAGEGEKYVIESHQQTKIDGTKYDEGNSLMIFCDGRSLLDSSGELVLPAEKFFNFKTVTIGQSLEDQNSTGVVNYEVKLEPPRGSSVNTKTLKFSRDPVLDHDYGWSVQFINGSVKLTRDEEGVTMTLDPSKLFSSNIVDNPETSLLGMVLKFWPRTFADLISKDKLRETVRVVNELMHQVNKYSVAPSNVQVAEVMKKVSELNKLCTAKVEWYRPLFPGMFPPVVGQMAEVDPEKLEKFGTAIACLLRPPNSLSGRRS